MLSAIKKINPAVFSVLNKNRKKFNPLNVMLNTFLILSTIVWLFPFYWALSCSFKTEYEMFKIPPEWFPLKPTLDNYMELFAKTHALQWGFNSFFVAIVSMILVCIFGCMAGYSFSKLKFRGMGVMFTLMVASMMLPKYVLLVPLFRMMKNFSWLDKFEGLIIPEVAICLPFGVFMMRQFIHSIPNELVESGKIDGCNPMGIFVKIILPLTKPAMAALAIFTFVRSWNDFMWQMIVVKSNGMKTLPLGIAGLQQELLVQYSQVMAGAILSSLPLIVIFIIFQQYFTRGLTMGAVKG